MMSRRTRIIVEILNALLCFAFGFYTNQGWLFWFAWASVIAFAIEVIWFIVEVWMYAEILNHND